MPIVCKYDISLHPEIRHHFDTNVHIYIHLCVCVIRIVFCPFRCFSLNLKRRLFFPFFSVQNLFFQFISVSLKCCPCRAYTWNSFRLLASVPSNIGLFESIQLPLEHFMQLFLTFHLSMKTKNIRNNILSVIIIVDYLWITLLENDNYYWCY